MKRNILIFIGLAIVVAAYTTWSDYRNFIHDMKMAEEKGIRAGAEAPDFTYEDINGAISSLSKQKGKIVLLNFWASWCGPCITEFPQLLNLAAAYPDDVVLLALSSDHDKAMMDRFITKLKKDNGAKATAANVIIARDDDQSIIQPIYGSVRLPETIIIDRTGIMRKKIAGAIEWDSPEMMEKIRVLAGE